MERVAAFIDGFNVYHSIAEAKFNDCKWLNYHSLAQAFTKSKTQRLESVYYFSALVPWDEQKLKRHKLYIKALESVDVHVVLGRFKRVTRKCRGTCRETFSTFEEKETDVNIAVTMLRLAMQDDFDCAMLFSGDSDMVPALKNIKNVAPHKHLKVVVPFNRSSIELKNTCDESAKLKRKHLTRHQFSDTIILDQKTGTSICRPPEWK